MARSVSDVLPQVLRDAGLPNLARAIERRHTSRDAWLVRVSEVRPTVQPEQARDALSHVRPSR